jgi:predicted Zn finger-like uncharacterized protein
LAAGWLRKGYTEGVMKAKCGNCSAEYVLKDSQIAQHAKVQFRCTKCGKTSVVDVKLRPDATIVMSPLPSFARTGTDFGGSSIGMPDAELALPEGTTASLLVIEGPDKGLKRKIEKASVILGRQGADVSLNDPEISRAHCLLEVKQTYINLKDMDSTNGTFFEDERVRAAMLQDGSEFRIGNSVIRISFEHKA